jgi:hypothetical protein
MGVHPNSYFYWQRKLRESICEKIDSRALSAPEGWATATTETEPARISAELPIEIGAFRVIAGQDTDEMLLAKVCRILASL